jgi:hypothetical protein
MVTTPNHVQCSCALTVLLKLSLWLLCHCVNDNSDSSCGLRCCHAMPLNIHFYPASCTHAQSFILRELQAISYALSEWVCGLQMPSYCRHFESSNITLTPGKKAIQLLGGSLCSRSDPMCWCQMNGLDEDCFAGGCHGLI